MNKKQKILLAMLGLQKPNELCGKCLEVTFTQNDTEDDKSDGNLIEQTLFFFVISFTLEDGQLSFPPVPLGQGNEFVQVSIFGKDRYHIAISNKQGNQIGYYFSNSEFKSVGVIRGKISIA